MKSARPPLRGREEPPPFLCAMMQSFSGNFKIMNKDQIFEATATVLYSRPTMGMAVAFREVQPVFQSILEDWLHQSLKQQDQKPSIDDFETE
jgi:hypothetical protein